MFEVGDLLASKTEQFESFGMGIIYDIKDQKIFIRFQNYKSSIWVFKWLLSYVEDGIFEHQKQNDASS